MRSSLAFLVFLGFSALTLRGGETPPAAAGSLFSGADGAAWRELVTQLGAQGNVSCAFTETRWFSLRKQPVVLVGEMRMSGTHGLSLHYAEKGGRTMIIDARGILLRDDRGRSRSVPADAPAAGVGALLLPVLRFDLAELERNFSLAGERDGPSWRLELAPKSEDLAKTLRSIAIVGEGEKVQRIEIDRGGKQRIEIEVRDTKTDVTFSADEVKKFFRAVP